jgi:hypothetical protein
MSIGVQARLGLIILTAGCVVSARAQTEEGHPAPTQALASPSTSVPNQQPTPGGAVIREINDPHTGDRWLLMRDPSRPGAPGRMVLAQTGTSRLRQAGTEDAAPVASWPATPVQSIPVIHAGDRLVVEEHTPMVETHLEGVALGQALGGAPLNVRLAIGGNVVRAVALGPGRAVFAQAVGVRP